MKDGLLAFLLPLLPIIIPTDVGTVTYVPPIAINGISTIKLVQNVTLLTNVSDSSSAVIPNDDTIPQSNEGKEFVTLSITPKSADNTLLLCFKCHCATSVGTAAVLTLFKDSDTDALSASKNYSGTANAMILNEVFHVMKAPSTNAITFKVRFGPGATATMYINKIQSGEYYGGTMYSLFQIQEIAP